MANGRTKDPEKAGSEKEETGTARQKSPQDKLMEKLPGASPPSESEAEGEGDGALEKE